jgi:hypothetical protein
MVPLEGMMMNQPDIQELWQRLLVVEDELAIRRRMHAYLGSCDSTKTPQEIAAHFTERGTWEGVGRNTEFGVARGRSDIAALFDAVPARQPFTVHYLTNDYVEVDGDVARGRWLCFEPSAIREGTLAVWIGLSYDNEFQRTDGQWLISHLRCDTLFASPFGEGWVKRRYVSVTGLADDDVA